MVLLQFEVKMGIRCTYKRISNSLAAPATVSISRARHLPSQMTTEGDMSRTKPLRENIKITTLSERLAVAVLGGVLGTFILLGVGFASANLIHNAAHDARHVNSFPCH